MTASVGCCDEPLEKWVRLVGFTLELGMKLAGHEIQAMSKATFYFVITVLVLTEVVQSRYKRKLLQNKQAPATS